jgi:hypothetical protein
VMRASGAVRPGWAAVLKVVPGTPVQASKESEMDCSISLSWGGRALCGDGEDRGAGEREGRAPASIQGRGECEVPAVWLRATAG